MRNPPDAGAHKTQRRRAIIRHAVAPIPEKNALETVRLCGGLGDFLASV